jgi:glycosyltransferase involved in cell wall biosynthesis
MESTLGGTRKHIVDLLCNISLEQVDLTFIYSKQRADLLFGEGLKKIQQRGIHCVEVEMNKKLFSAANRKAVASIRNYLKENQIEVVHVQSGIAGFLGRVAAWGLPSVRKIYYSPHGGSLHLMSGLKGIPVKWMEKLLVFKNVELVAVSLYEKNRIGTMLGIQPDKIHCVYNGIEFVNGKATAPRTELLARLEIDTAKNPLIVLIPAVLLPAKGHVHFFTEAVKHAGLSNQNIFFLLAGDGPEEEHIRAVIKDSPLAERVKFLGFQKNIAQWFNCCDLVLLPSLNEAFGYVVLEAFLHEKPVLATRVGALPELIQHGLNGLLFDLDKLNLLLDDIVEFSSKRDSLSGLVRNASELVSSKFSIQQMVDKTANLYVSA